MRFCDIPDHQDIKSRLRSLADNNHIPHAILLEGPSGTGKFALARAFAQYIHCENRNDGDSCGKCPSCLQHESLNHIDTIYSFPVIKKSGKTALSDDYIADFSDFIKEDMFMDFEKWLTALDNINAQPQIYVEEANELIRRLNFTAHRSKYKIVLMWLPERMKEETANKLLKLVEEPHSDTIFIMASDNPGAILPTIYSRTQRITIKRYDSMTITGYLCGNFAVSEVNASEIARLSGGSMTEAIKLISVTKERQKYLELFIQLMRLAYQRRIGDLKQWSMDVAGLGREQEMRFFEYCNRLLRENFILNMQIGELNYLNEPELQFCTNFSRFITDKNVLRLFDVFNKAVTDISANANARIVTFDVAIKVILLLK